MELRQLRYLRAIAQTGSFTAAAEREAVEQPAISRQIKLLEDELGVPLFDRVGRRVRLTQAGLVALQYAERALGAIDDLRAELIEDARAERGRLRICATETVMDYLLPTALSTIRARYPRLHVSAEMLGTDDSVALLLNHHADAAVIVLPLKHDRLEIEALFSEDVVLLTPIDDPLARHRSVGLRELADRELLLSMPGHGLRATVEASCARAGFAPRVALEMRSQEALIRLVERGAGIAFAPLLCVRGAHRAVHICEVVNPRLQRHIGWARLRGRHTPSVAFELMRLLSEQKPGDKAFKGTD